MFAGTECAVLGNPETAGYIHNLSPFLKIHFDVIKSDISAGSALQDI